jgi:aldehyde dehydrogenase (NAD+)
MGQVLQSLVPYSMPITGQVCFSLTRVLTPESRKQDVLDAYVGAVKNVKVGDPQNPETQMGPLTMQRQLERVQGYIAKGKEEGAKLVLGGGRPKGSTAATSSSRPCSADVDTKMTIAQEEIFGPVVSFIAYEGLDDAVAKANDTTYGLHGAVYTADAGARLSDRAPHAARAASP